MPDQDPKQDSKSIAHNFNNLPLETLISGPLVAAANSNILLANATYDFIKNVWLKDASETSDGAPRMLSFTLEKPVKDGTPTQQKINAPLAALLETPNLMVRSIDVEFSMEVKDVTTEKKDVAVKTDLELSAQGLWWSAKLTGSLSGSSSRSRSTDRSAKYEIRLRADQSDPTEGMSRLAQIFASAVGPSNTAEQA